MERRRKQRRGTLYLAVLGVSTIVSVLALAAMHAARAQLASTTQAADRVEARLLAQSAIEHAVAVFNDDADWRTNYAVDTDYPAAPVASGRGRFTWRLASDGGQSRTLSGTAAVGEATCTLTVDLAQPPDLDCGLIVGGDLQVESGCTLTVEDAPISVNGAFANSGVTYGDLEAQSASGSSVIGTESVPGALRVLPTPGMVFDYYEKVGAQLTPSVSSGKTKIRFTLLSPTSSFGATNSDGIYVIDSRSRDVQIEFSRIVGTLVVTNLEEGKKVIVYGDVNWEPAYPNYPALLVDGDVEIQTSYDGLLEESSMSGGNYNPAGTPFKGQADTDEADEYISSIAGLIYCSGNLTIDGGGDNREPDLRGVVIAGGDCTVQDDTLPTIKYDATFATNPPPGFESVEAADVESEVSLLRSYSGSGSQDELLQDKLWAQYFKPTLPADAVAWRVTRAEVYCSRSTSNRDLEVMLSLPDGSSMPSASVVDSVAVNSNAFSVSWGWQGVDFTGTSNLPADQGVCLVLNTDAEDAPLEISYLSGGVSEADSALSTGDPTWNSSETDKALLCRIYGVYTTSAGVVKPVVIVPGSWR